MMNNSLEGSGSGGGRRGFTLVELLVVVAVIALLIGLLLPALGKARDSARELKCAANIRNVGQGVTIYTASQEVYPLSYAYRSSTKSANWTFNDQKESNDNATGYLHWSSSLLESESGSVAHEAFECPSMYNGGAPRTNPGREERLWESWQEGDDGATRSNPSELEDLQAHRMAYTANAAIMPRNKLNVQTPRKAQFVRPAVIKNGARTILAAEFHESSAWKLISDSNGRSVSHRPVFPFQSLSGYGNAIFSTANSPGNETPRFRYFRENEIRTQASQAVGEALMEDSQGEISAIARHHAGKDKFGGSSNFLFVDGHVGKYTIWQTQSERLWGDKVYSLSGSGTRIPTLLEEQGQ